MSIHIQLLTEDVVNQKLLNEILELWNENNEMIGFGLASIKKDFIYDMNYGQIDEVYVVPVYRRQKVAKRLVDHLVNWFNDEHDTTVVNVYVDLENDLALNFWEGIGLEKEFFMLSNN
ncbi:GNAT family N-acetyltransferase [Lysinibacillus sp. RC79]|uniref:GNAT family N-acetyltransferase n=1 Tax=Lysinibacillus sp. RC79 TaxID=3156296 RepID=UPI003513CF92